MSSPHRPLSTDISGAHLRHLRARARVSLAEVGRRMGVSRQAVWRMENPDRYLTAEAAARYLDAVRGAASDRHSRSAALLPDLDLHLTDEG